MRAKNQENKQTTLTGIDSVHGQGQEVPLPPLLPSRPRHHLRPQPAGPREAWSRRGGQCRKGLITPRGYGLF